MKPRAAATLRAAAWLVGLSLSSLAWGAADDERPDAVPYRPTVSTPAALSAPGWLEGEFGGQYVRDRHAEDSPDRRVSVPYTIKYAFSDDWGVRIGGEALVRASIDGSRETGFGDTALVLKRRFAVNTASAFGLEAGVLLPSAKRALQIGSGKPDWSLNGIYSADVGAWHADVNLEATRLGGRSDGQSRGLGLAALALSHPLGDTWTIEGEVSGTRQHGNGSTAQALGALSYALRRDVVLDFGAAHGLNRATPTWQGFAGLTVVIGRLD